MPDLNPFIESLQRGFAEIPPVAIALFLLAGPTAALIGYRLLSASRRLQNAGEIESAPFWVCHDCRSVNELRHTRCYHCGISRDASEELEIIVDEPSRGPAFFEAPEGSPFAALGAKRPFVEDAVPSTSGPGVPVMGPRPSDAVAVGPGQPSASVDELEPDAVTPRGEGTR